MAASSSADSAIPSNTPSEEERKWAAYAHQSIFWLWIVYLWFGSLVATTLLLEMYKAKSRYVAFHARQTLYLQIVVIVLLGPILVTSRFVELSSLDRTVMILLSALSIAGIVILLAAMVGALNAVQRVRQGKDFEYWLVGRWAREPDRKEPLPTTMAAEPGEGDVPS